MSENNKRPGYLAKTVEAKTVEAEPTMLQTIDDIEAKCFKTLEARQLSMMLELPVLLWLDIVSELRNRNPRNYSQLLRDDMMDRLEGAIERLHEEVTFVIASGPAPVSERVGPQRQHLKRQIVSDELKRSLKDLKP